MYFRMLSRSRCNLHAPPSSCLHMWLISQMFALGDKTRPRERYHNIDAQYSVRFRPNMKVTLIRNAQVKSRVGRKLAFLIQLISSATSCSLVCLCDLKILLYTIMEKDGLLINNVKCLYTLYIQRCPGDLSYIMNRFWRHKFFVNYFNYSIVIISILSLY